MNNLCLLKGMTLLYSTVARSARECGTSVVEASVALTNVAESTRIGEVQTVVRGDDRLLRRIGARDVWVDELLRYAAARRAASAADHGATVLHGTPSVPVGERSS